MKQYVYLYDTTLRDGAQTEGVDFSAADKAQLAERLDRLHIDFIEGGWNLANPTDTQFFANLPALKNAQMTVFGMTKKKGDDAFFESWAKTPVQNMTIVGKTWDFHVENALGITLEDNLRVIADSVKYLVSLGKTVFFDAEHFFDGFKNNKVYALKCIQTAYEAGARWVVLCDTNGGCMPFEIEHVIVEVSHVVPTTHLGIHCHNDTGNAVANSLTAIQAGVCQVQGTINGLGERCGNADLMTVIPNLVLKMGYACGIGAEELKLLTPLSHFLYEKLNQAPAKNQPYVGSSAFAHKGGLHVSAINKNPKSYEHTSPDVVGNHRKILVSSQSGKSNIMAQLKEAGIELEATDPRVGQLLQLVKEREKEGYSYDAAEASFEVLARSFLFGLKPLFDLKSFRVIDERRFNAMGKLEMMSDATVQLSVGGKSYIDANTGNGPVDALFNALFKILLPIYPRLQDFKLSDYKVRILNAEKGTGASTRVSIDTVNKKGKRWSTVGISTNIIDASFQAITDSLLYGYYCVND